MNDENIEWRSVALLRVTGYALLLLALFDIVNVFIPPNFTNPIWEFQALGSLVEKSPVPLIGLVLVFYYKDFLRRDFEEVILKFFSWASLALGILFFLLLPLGVNNTFRINNYNNLQINNRISQQTSQLQKIKDRLTGTASETEINNLFQALNRQGSPPDIKNPQELKVRLLSDLQIAQKKVITESEAARKNQKVSLIKNSVKWNLGAIICGVLFIYIWQITSWAR